MIKAVLFDLDGTLLPMDLGKFLKAYLGALAKDIAPLGYPPEKLGEVMWNGFYVMIGNHGPKTNEEVFWDSFCTALGGTREEHTKNFEPFYINTFDSISDSCGYTPRAKETVDLVRSLGYIPVLATSPLYPRIATEKRMRWAGLETSDFELVTTFEDFTSAKPSPDYYVEVARRIGVRPEECLMVGNDTKDDMIAESVGMRVFLLTDCLINKSGEDISRYPHGGFDELINTIKTLN